MKPIIQKLMMLIAMLCAFIPASAYDFEVDGIAYTITDFSNLKCIVDKHDIEYVGEYFIPSNVEYVGKTLTVSGVSANAFKGAKELTAITLSEGVNLNGGNSFQGCISLEKVTLPETLSHIPSYCFEGCKNLATINIPSNCNSIGEYAFANCESIIKFDTGSCINTIGKQAFANCKSLLTFVIGKGIKDIECDWFGEQCTSLKQLVISDSPEKLRFTGGGSKPLYMNIPLDDVYIGRTIEGYNYYGDYNRYIPTPFILHPTLRKVVFGGNAEYIPRSSATINNSSDVTHNLGAFYGCVNLELVMMIDDSFKFIDAKTFKGCVNLKNIELSSGLISCFDNAFDGCSSLEDVIIPMSCTSIGNYCFNGCINLENVTIGDNLEIIGDHAFDGCVKLSKINIPKSVKEIRDKSFNDNIALKEIIFSSSAKISLDAFAGCNNIEQISFSEFSLPYFETSYTSSNPFSNNVYLNAKLCVPYKSSNKYLEHNDWGKFFNILEISKNVYEIDGIIYKVNTENSVEIINHNELLGSNLVIPSYINIENNEYIVNRISDNAFADCPGICSTYIPNTIEYIGCNAFYGCPLTEIVIEDGDSPIYLDCSNVPYLENQPRIDGRPWRANIFGLNPYVIVRYYNGLFSRLNSLKKVYLGRSIDYPHYTSSISPYYSDVVGCAYDNKHDSPFYACANLSMVTIGDKVCSLGTNDTINCLFYNKLIVTPDLFKECEDIKVVVSNNPMAPMGAFFSQTVYENATLFLPNGVNESYKADDSWKRFSYMEGSPFIATESIVFDTDEIIIDINESKKLLPIINPEDASIKKLKWSSSAPSIVSVSEDGTITSNTRNGDATITVSACDGTGLSASIKVVVKEGAGVKESFADDEFEVYVENGKIFICGKDESDVVDVFNIQGQFVTSSASDTIDLHTKGMYIVKIGGNSKKIIL